MKRLHPSQRVYSLHEVDGDFSTGVERQRKKFRFKFSNFLAITHPMALIRINEKQSLSGAFYSKGLDSLNFTF